MSTNKDSTMLTLALGPVKLTLNITAVLLSGLLYFGFLVLWLRSYWTMSLWAQVIILLTPLWAYMLSEKSQSSSKELYGDFHIPLNAIPGEENSGVGTEWLNMGYWKDTTIFPYACEDLALRVAKLACLLPGNVLDVGHGSGDSLLMQLFHPELPRPLTLTGITSIPKQHIRATKRVADRMSALEGPNSYIPIDLYLGDAVFRAPTSLSRHPLDPAPSQDITQYTSIMALDCAYHFHSREAFLTQCFARLQPKDGRIALADMCFQASDSTSYAAKFTARLIARTLSIPSINLVTMAEYREQLEGIGFDDINIEDISMDVFPAFASFLRSRGFLWACFASLIERWHKGGGRFVLVSARRPQ